MGKLIDIITWVGTRDGKVVGTFMDRKQAVKWIKGLLSQTLRDLSKQDKTDEFNYPFKIFETEIKPVEARESYLSLI